MKNLKETIITAIEDSKRIYLKHLKPLNVAILISSNAHLYDKRLNGRPYLEHPRGCLEMFEHLITYMGSSSPSYLEECYVPYKGVKEVAVLHDVVEDTELSFEDVRDMFSVFGFRNHFDRYIAKPLTLITHDKNESYDTYIDKVLTNPVSSLAKMLDLNDNLNLFGLDKFDQEELERAIKYLHYFKKINDKYHFVENINQYYYGYSNFVEDFHKPFFDE